VASSLYFLKKAILYNVKCYM